MARSGYGAGANQIGRAGIVFPAPVVSAVTTAADAAIQIVSSNSWITIGAGISLQPTRTAPGERRISPEASCRGVWMESAPRLTGRRPTSPISAPSRSTCSRRPVCLWLGDVVISNGSLVSASFRFCFRPTRRPFRLHRAEPEVRRRDLRPEGGSFDYLAPAGAFGTGVSSRPAQPGETVALFGTGFGPTSPAPPAGQVLTTAYPRPPA